MHRTLLLLLLLLNYFTDMFHICMIQWNNNKYEYEYNHVMTARYLLLP